MNFTHLVEGPTEPDQELLQRYQHYVVVVALTDDIVNFVLEKSGFEMRSSSSALCWVLQPVHLRTAPPGTVLARIHEVLTTHRFYGHIEHSFLAAISKEELLNGDDAAGLYMPLFLHTEDDVSRRAEELRRAVSSALERAQAGKKGRAIEAVQSVVSVASLIKDVIGVFV